MGRAAFLALVQTSPRDAAATARLASLIARMKGEGAWRAAGATGRATLWIGGAAPPKIQTLALLGGFVIGDVFAMPGASAALSPLNDPGSGSRQPPETARRLSQAHWGRYVAILHGPSPHTTAAFRDPSGALNCLSWSLGDGLDVIASELALVPGFLRPPRQSLNWHRIARYLAVPAASTADVLFDGLVVIGPGVLRTIGDEPPVSEPIWSPADFVEPGVGAASAQGAELVRRVDDCTRALTGGYDRLMVEVSGGLDSAILAAAIAEGGLTPKVASWLNRVGDRAESDEGAYARAVTDRIGAPLTAIPKPMTFLDAEALRETAASLLPAITAADAGTDRDAAARLQALGAQGLVSGQGGDAVFFQMPSALVFADALRRDGLRALASPLLGDVARRTRQSVWAVLRQVREARLGRAAPTMAVSSLASGAVRAAFAGAEHPWVSAARAKGVTAGKRLQIEAIANCQIYYDDSRRHRVADPLFPLLAQPVVELCLSLPSTDLASGPFDRPYARAVFADRLPDVVRARRSKGNMSAFFARLVASNLATLRPFLLDGALCEAGLLDRDVLDRTLDANLLIWSGQPMDVLWAASLEAWVRYWQGRVPDSASAPRSRP